MSDGSALARHLRSSATCRRESSGFQSSSRSYCECGWMCDDDGPVSKRLFVAGRTLSEDSSSAGRVVDEVSSAGYARVAVSRSSAEWVMRTEPKKPDRAARDDGPLDALISRYQACVWNVLAMFDGDPLPADDPSHFCIERLEALIRRGLIGPKGALPARPEDVVPSFRGAAEFQAKAFAEAYLAARPPKADSCPWCGADDEHAVKPNARQRYPETDAEIRKRLPQVLMWPCPMCGTGSSKAAADPNSTVLVVPERDGDGYAWGSWRCTPKEAEQRLAAMYARTWNDHVQFSPECGSRAVDNNTVHEIMRGTLSCDCGWRARHTKKDEDEREEEEHRWDNG